MTSPGASPPGASPPGALVLGGDYRGLGIVRSLGRRGVPVWAVHGRHGLASRSRYCRHRVVTDVAETDGERYVELLQRLATLHRLDGWVLFPTSDESAWTVSQHWDTLANHFRLTTPPRDVYAAAADKVSVHGIATRLGIDTPRTWFPRGGEDVARLDADYPLVLKPARRESINVLTAAKAWRVDDHDELQRRYRDAVQVVPAEHVMVQEWVPGGGDHQYAFAAVCSAGKPRLSVAVRRTRQYPRDFGRASTYVETVEHAGVAEQAERLLRELGVSGLVEVEFKQDGSSGALKLLDVNVRAWGWHSLGAAAGVDFSYAAYQLARGAELPRVHGSVGVRWVRLTTDLPYALADIAAGRMRAGDYLHTLRRPLEGPIWAGDDPLPAVLELPLALASAGQRFGHGGRRRELSLRP